MITWVFLGVVVTVMVAWYFRMVRRQWQKAAATIKALAVATEARQAAHELNRRAEELQARKRELDVLLFSVRLGHKRCRELQRLGLLPMRRRWSVTGKGSSYRFPRGHR